MGKKQMYLLCSNKIEGKYFQALEVGDIYYQVAWGGGIIYQQDAKEKNNLEHYA